MDKILVTGACGQLGSELIIALRSKYGVEHVIATDIRDPLDSIKDGPFYHLDVLDESALNQLIEQENINQIYHLAAILSAKGEEKPIPSWDINMKSLLFILEACRKYKISKMFWPSSIAAFGNESPKINTPQQCVMNPNTVYGISKLAGERWCEYYYHHYGCDIRSLRYPGLISYKTLPGGGTTDYAIDIFLKAVAGEPFTCFLDKDTALPMMFMDDAIRGTVEVMEASRKRISIRSSYNLAATTFTPEELANGIKVLIPEFKIIYKPDFRQKIANTWPQSIDDSVARSDWHWNHEFDTKKIVQVMVENLLVKN